MSVAGSRQTIRDERSGWAITYRVDRDAAGALNLEFYATNRRTNDRHVLITADGQGEYLEAISEMLIANSDNAVADFRARNEAVAQAASGARPVLARSVVHPPHRLPVADFKCTNRDRRGVQLRAWRYP